MSLAARLIRRQAYLDQLAENAGRLARVAISYDTVGAGELKLDSPVSFELAFTEEPVVMCGVALVGHRHLRPTNYPNVSSGVWKWQRSSKGLYTGAWLYFVCDVGDTDPSLVLWTPTILRMRHSIVFEGDAIKMFPVELLT